MIPGRTLSADNIYRPIPLQSFFIVMYFIFSSGGFNPKLEFLNFAEYFRSAIITIVCFILIVLLFHRDGPSYIKTKLFKMQIVSFFCLLTLSMFSIFVSENPAYSIGKIFLNFLSFALLPILVWSVPERSWSRLLHMTLVGICCASILLVVLFPAAGIMSGRANAGAWSGIFSNKNQLAMCASVVWIISFNAIVKTANINFRYLCYLIFSVVISSVILLFAKSDNSNLVAIIGSIFVVLYRPGKISIILTCMSLFFIFSFVVIYLSNPDEYLSVLYGAYDHQNIFGMSVEFSGRTKIWGFGAQTWREHPIFGVGIGSFWTDQRISEFYGVLGWSLEDFHNGYITAIVEGGFAGAFLIAICYVGPIISYKSRNVDRSYYKIQVWAIVYIVLLIGNSFETYFLRGVRLENILLILSSFYILRLSSGHADATSSQVLVD